MASMSSRGSGSWTAKENEAFEKALAVKGRGPRGIFHGCVPMVVCYGVAVSRCVPLLGEVGGQRGCVRESDLLRRRSTVKEKMKLQVWDLERLWV
ncbi:hypothetical protein RHSIM_Rhsim09G0177300 [Rhododendron simsii]|uniref:Uncharacterized protein n=1 Tax=Rhododendron simsii TaxID=118357 RepID=A0A834GK81_RHOSS|nr:hypothetical protein RHSIM_Rhsim09G0177300 [Rhododendron simsii]